MPLIGHLGRWKQAAAGGSATELAWLSMQTATSLGTSKTWTGIDFGDPDTVVAAIGTGELGTDDITAVSVLGSSLTKQASIISNSGNVRTHIWSGSVSGSGVGDLVVSLSGSGNPRLGVGLYRLVGFSATAEDVLELNGKDAMGSTDPSDLVTTAGAAMIGVTSGNLPPPRVTWSNIDGDVEASISADIVATASHVSTLGGSVDVRANGVSGDRYASTCFASFPLL